MTDAENSLVAEPAAGAVSLPRATHPRPQTALRSAARIVVFFAVLVSVVLLFNHLVVSGLRQIRTSKFGSMNRIVGGEVNADIVVNGSSRALTHYDPRVLAGVTGLSTYNLGMNGIQTDVQGAILKTYLRHNRKPRLVIQNLESFTFEATKAGQIYDPGVYVPYLSEPELYETLVAIDPAVWKWKHIPLYGYTVEDIRFTWLAGVLGYFGYNGPEDYIDGFTPRHIGWTEDFERFRASVPHGIEYQIEPRGVRALVDLLATCQAQQIPVLLVYSPEYFEMQSLERNRPQIFSMFQKIADRFGVEVWDFSDSPIARNRENFYNSQHLNADGARVFSLELARRIAAGGITSRVPAISTTGNQDAAPPRSPSAR